MAKHNNLGKQLYEWLETHWVSPAYSGGLLLAIALCFFGAATNTLAGWLYTISGTIFALLIIGAIMPPRSLSKLQIRRLPIAPVSAQDRLTVQLEIFNAGPTPKTLLEIADLLPVSLAPPQQTPIAYLAPQETYRWTYSPTATRRGLYHWQTVQLRSGTPLGLFWCRRYQEIPAKAIVYPTVIPLSRCPLIDSLGLETSTDLNRDRRYHSANEGLTRTLRAYRRGDAIRLIHWRTSARFGQLQVRELETLTGGPDIVIALDSAAPWIAEDFEQAVIAAASLYFYANRRQLNVQLWSAATGLLRGNRVVLETLAAIQPQETPVTAQLPNQPLLWLTQTPDSLPGLPLGSRWLYFTHPDSPPPAANLPCLGLICDRQTPLEPQLQRPLLR